MELLEEIVKKSKIHPSRIFNITIFGSRVYGNFSDVSDFDVIMVANNSIESSEIRNGLFNIHVYTPTKFKSDLDWHKPNILECFFAPSNFILKNDIKFDFNLDKAKIRHSVSHTSSNSWVKAKKKILYQPDEYYIGIKSLFHSIRIPMFATQIASSGRITDFSCANWIWDKLTFKDQPIYMRNKMKWSWDKLDEEFGTIHNQVLTEFRKVAGK